jgi:ubiquinone biosynthesis protein UbiJ
MVSLLSTGLTSVLQAAVNRLIELDQNAKRQFQSLAGKVLAVEFSDLPLKLYFLPTADDMQVYSQYDGVVDTRLRGSSMQLFAMGVSERPGESLFKGKVQIEGDTEVGQQFQDILHNLDIDWEEHLSTFLGDVAAHKLGNAIRGVFQWGRQSAVSFQANLSEYIQFETDSIPPRFEMEEFIQNVDVLRNDTERLHARVQRLCKALGDKADGTSVSDTTHKAVD